MVKTDVAEKVIQIVSEKAAISKDKLTLTSSFTQDLGFDSLARMDLVVALEDAFQLTIPDEDAEKVKTIGDAVSYIKKRMGN